MNEWKELEIGNLPSDILVGDYEFAYFNGIDNEQLLESGDNIGKSIIMKIIYRQIKAVRYRKIQQKAPSHEEIMKPRFWKMDDSECWRTIQGYRMENGVSQYLIKSIWWDADRFIGLKSSDLPPQ